MKNKSEIFIGNRSDDDFAAKYKTAEAQWILDNQKKPHQKHGSNYTPPKRRNRKK